MKLLLVFTIGVMTEWSPFDRSGELELDADGFVTGMSAGSHRVTFGLDGLGRVVSTTDAYGATESAELDARGEQISYTDADGRTRRWEYDDRGFLVRELDSQGRAKTYSYDDAGRALQEVSRNGTVVDYNYDDLGRLESVIGPDAWVAYDYDTLGRVVRIENAHKRGWSAARPNSRSQGRRKPLGPSACRAAV